MTPLHIEIAILALSSLFQLLAAGVAFYLVRYSGAYRWAWVCISVALFLMAERRVEPLYYAVTRGEVSPTLSSTVGLAISVLMVVGVLGVRTLFVQLKAQEASLRQLATTDSLTGLPNRGETLNQAHRETERHLRLARPLAALMVDIDHFKQVNDSYGHAEGDRVLKALADTCRASLRKIDVFGRVGGEEFLAVLPETDPTEAQGAGERLRAAVEERFGEKDRPAVTVSVGVATLDPKEQRTEAALKEMLKEADEALYRAKAEGRNRVTVSPSH